MMTTIVSDLLLTDAFLIKGQVENKYTRLSQLLERVERGEEFVIARAGKPVARLIAYDGRERDRQGGAWKGLVRIAEDFDEPLPDEIAQPFTGAT